jgi:flagellar biosynthesis regulator FlaF
MGKGTLVAYLAAGFLLAGEAVGTNRVDPTEQAQQAGAAVAEARLAIEAAAQKRALWTSAQEALKRAEDALFQHDYAAAVWFAQFAAEQARLGVEQLGYPDFQ